MKPARKRNKHYCPQCRDTHRTLANYMLSVIRLQQDFQELRATLARRDAALDSWHHEFELFEVGLGMVMNELGITPNDKEGVLQ